MFFFNYYYWDQVTVLEVTTAGNKSFSDTVESLLWDTSNQGTPPSRGHKIWSWKNVHIIFVIVTFLRKGHYFWVLKPGFNIHSRDTLALKRWLTKRRFDKLKCRLVGHTDDRSHLNRCTAVLGIFKTHRRYGSLTLWQKSSTVLTEKRWLTLIWYVAEADLKKGPWGPGLQEPHF